MTFLLGDAGQFRLSESRAAVLDLLRELKAPMTPKAIAAALGKKEDAMRQTLTRMAKDGQLLNTEGRYSVPPESAVTAVTLSLPSSVNGDSSPESDTSDRSDSTTGVSSP